MRLAHATALLRIALTALIFSSPAALAAPPSAAEFNKLVKDAERLYGAGKYQESAEKLIEAYAYQPNPRLIYNIARAYDQAGELDLSVEYYQRYVGSKEGTDPTLLKRSALAIDRIRGLVEQRETTRRKQAEEQARVEAEAKEARERAESEALAKQKAEEALRAREKAAAERREQARKTGKIAAYSLGALAVAGFGAGTFFGIRANQTKDQFNSAETVADKQVHEQSTRTNALIADASLATGLVAAVLAVVLYPKGAEQPATSTSVTFVPAAGGAGVAVRF